MVQEHWRTLCIGPSATLRETLGVINRGGVGVALVSNGGKLIATVTDGDIRRALLANEDLESPVGSLLKLKVTTQFGVPITAPLDTAPDVSLSIMRREQIRHLPLIDNDDALAGLVTIEELIPEEEPLRAVIMAGGLGTRLRPLTEALPKPMLPVGGRPLMERMVQQLQEAGVRKVDVSTHYKADKIVEHFGDGRALGVELTYLKEDEPLGTAGALGLREKPKGPLLVMNGDILTSTNFRAMLAYHREHSAALTVAVRRYEVPVPYGVVECDSQSLITKVVEKPLLNFMVNAGMYLMDPLVHSHIPKGIRCDMTEVVESLLGRGEKVVSFPIHEYWIDIGQGTDYLRAQEDIKSGRLNE